MKKINKFVLPLASLAAVAAPMGAVIACGGTGGFKGRYDAENDGKMRISTSFSKTGSQYKALEALVQQWNKVDGNMQIEIVGVEGGYSAQGPFLSKTFEAADKVKVPNFVISYPDDIGVISKYDMTLPLATGADATAIKGLFNDQFLEINDQIGGVEAGGLFALPIAKSIDMATINTPVFHYVMSQVGVSDIPAGWTHATGDAGDVAKIWGPAKAGAALDAVKAKAYKYDEMMADSEKLLEFVADVMPLFPTAITNKAYILGLDSTTNFIYQSVYSKVGADISKFLFNKDAGKEGYINYANWNNHSSDGFAAFKAIYDKLNAAIKAHGIYANIGGAYSSALETQHKMALAFGSTAGYTHNFVGSGVPYATIAGEKVLFNSYTDVLTKNTTDATIIGTFGKYNNKIYTSTSTSAGKYDVKLADATADSAVGKFLTDHAANVYVSSGSEVAKLAADKKLQISQGTHPKFLVALDGIGSTTSSLQEEELMITNTPWKFGASSAQAQLVQGPSLIGVHTNAAEDIAAQKFVKWIMTGGNVTTSDGHGHSHTYTQPYELFATLAGYIVPTKHSFSGTAKGNPAQKLTFNTLKAINDEAAKHPFDNPADPTTGTFRKTLQSTVNAQYTAADSGHATVDASRVYDLIKRGME